MAPLAVFAIAAPSTRAVPRGSILKGRVLALRFFGGDEEPDSPPLIVLIDTDTGKSSPTGGPRFEDNGTFGPFQARSRLGGLPASRYMTPHSGFRTLRVY